MVSASSVIDNNILMTLSASAPIRLLATSPQSAVAVHARATINDMISPVYIVFFLRFRSAKIAYWRFSSFSLQGKIFSTIFAQR
jgi:hypothetical protein